ncbi:kelch-like protein diablo [Styela clava]
MAATSYKSRHANSFLVSVESLRKNTVICDFKIKVGGCIFPVHRTVLAACSEYFKAMLSHDMKESKEGIVELKDVDENAVEKAIYFMYNGEAEVKIDEVQSILHVSRFMQLEILNEICLDSMKNNISVDTVFCIRSIACLYSFDDLTQRCETFIEVNFEEIILTEDFASITKADILDFLGKLNVSHELLWQSVLSWIKYSSKASSRRVSTTMF